MNTANKYQVLIAYVVLFTFLFSGCAAVGGPDIAPGEVQGVFYSTARWIVDGCLTGDCLSRVYLNTQSNLAVYARPLLDNVAYVVTSRSIPLDKIQGGNLIDVATWEEFEAWLLANGYVLIENGNTLFEGLVAGMNSLEMVVPVFLLPVLPAFMQEQGGE